MNVRGPFGLAMTIALVAAGCVAPEAAVMSHPSPPEGGGDAAVSTSPAASVAPSKSPAATHFETSGYGLTLVADLGQTDVQPGGEIAITVRVRNGRTTPATYGYTSCDPGMTVAVPLALPLDPSGRTWTGIAARFKDYALTSGYGPGAVPATAPVVTGVASPACSIAGPAPTIAPGSVLTRTLTWQAEYAAGIPALPQATHLRLTLYFDPDTGPPPPSPSPGGVMGSRMVQFKELSIEAPISIAGPAPRLLTIGQAVDAFLADPQIGPWVAKPTSQPQWTVNLILENGEKTKYQPSGPAWDVEFFAEHNVPSGQSTLYGRNFVRAYIDPFDGHVIFRDFCNAPCDR